MKDINWLRDNYVAFLQEKTKESEAIIKKLQKEDRVDEANLEKIKLNIIEIFSKMFNISDSDNHIALREKYLNYFDKITKPWCVNKEKALEFDKQNEAIIEEIKIQEAESLKRKFKSYYSQMDIN